MGWELNLLDRYNDFISKFMDTITRALKNINSDHHAIHTGFGYCTHLYHASLAASGTKIYRIRTPLNNYDHIKAIQIALQGATCRFTLIKNPTITNAGVELTTVTSNLNDNSDRVNETKFYDGTVAYTGGVVWKSLIVHGDTQGKTKSSGNFIQNDYLEYITKNGNAEYVLLIQNLDGSDVASHIDIQFFFYEESQGLIT